MEKKRSSLITLIKQYIYKKVKIKFMQSQNHENK